MCEYCEADEAGGLKRLRDDPENSAWLEEGPDGEWGILIGTTTHCWGEDCTTEGYVRVTHCPMCGRKLVE